MKKIGSYVTAMVFCLASNAVLAKAEVKIEWQNPDEYRDVKPASQSRKSFEEQTFSRLEEYMAELAEDLPDGQVLSMTVTDLDLAGEVWPASFVGLGHSSSDVRLIKSLYIPRMSFSYVLTDNTGTTVQQGDIKLKDMSFQDHVNRTSRKDSLIYEKNMLKDWFSDEFPDLIAKK